VRLRTRQSRRHRHPAAPRVARAPQYPAHRPLYGTVAGTFQKSCSVLEREVKRRIKLDRPRLIERLQEAISDDSNLSENTEYQAVNQNKRSMRRALPNLKTSPHVPK